ncbi:MAG: endonuclease domain-containing protein [Defluviitaleaceae bacterium]|nr:endonuclease domain-containing protein [Defluviitaleaceae bacterium]
MLPRNKNLKSISRKLRNNATKQENHLWYNFLRKHNLQFYRQRIIGDYIVDFYCPNARLIIELDGSQHYEENAEKYDVSRTEYLSSIGLYILRFTNKDINDYFEEVCQKIEETILSQSVGKVRPQLPAPLEKELPHR